MREAEVGLSDIFNILKDNRILFVVFPIVACLVGFIVRFYSKPILTASAVFEITRNKIPALPGDPLIKCVPYQKELDNQRYSLKLETLIRNKDSLLHERVLKDSNYVLFFKTFNVRMENLGIIRVKFQTNSKVFAKGIISQIEKKINDLDEKTFQPVISCMNDEVMSQKQREQELMIELEKIMKEIDYAKAVKRRSLSELLLTYQNGLKQKRDETVAVKNKLEKLIANIQRPSAKLVGALSVTKKEENQSWFLYLVSYALMGIFVAIVIGYFQFALSLQNSIKKDL